jgi:hypothetical protein
MRDIRQKTLFCEGEWTTVSVLRFAKLLPSSSFLSANNIMTISAKSRHGTSRAARQVLSLSSPFCTAISSADEAPSSPLSATRYRKAQRELRALCHEQCLEIVRSLLIGRGYADCVWLSLNLFVYLPFVRFFSRTSILCGRPNFTHVKPRNSSIFRSLTERRMNIIAERVFRCQQAF